MSRVLADAPLPPMPAHLVRPARRGARRARPASHVPVHRQARRFQLVAAAAAAGGRGSAEEPVAVSPRSSAGGDSRTRGGAAAAGRRERLGAPARTAARRPRSRIAYAGGTAPGTDYTTAGPRPRSAVIAAEDRRTPAGHGDERRPAGPTRSLQRTAWPAARSRSRRLGDVRRPPGDRDRLRGSRRRPRGRRGSSAASVRPPTPIWWLVHARSHADVLESRPVRHGPAGLARTGPCAAPASGRGNPGGRRIGLRHCEANGAGPGDRFRRRSAGEAQL